MIKQKDEFEKDAHYRKKELQDMENRINQRQDLVDKREVEVTKIRNLGKKSLKEVLDKVADLGLTFKE